jgi:hypothetical protein
MNTKLYSNKQEQLVAKYLNGSVTSGSGARPFTPGDVDNSIFLVECKTHVKPQTKIVFNKKHWDKINIESRSKNRYPLLITDNGTQTIDNTWVLCNLNIIPSDCRSSISGFVSTSNTNNTITFNNSITKDLFAKSSSSAQYSLDKIYYFEYLWSGKAIAIMPITEFGKFIERWF